MRNILAALVLGFSVILGGCASTGGVPPTQTDVSAVIAQVQAYTKLACGFVPTATTIINIVGAAVPGVAVATSIANAICAAVAPPLMSGKHSFSVKKVGGYRVTPGTVNGVTIEGSRSR